MGFASRFKDAKPNEQLASISLLPAWCWACSLTTLTPFLRAPPTHCVPPADTLCARHSEGGQGTDPGQALQRPRPAGEPGPGDGHRTMPGHGGRGGFEDGLTHGAVHVRTLALSSGRAPPGCPSPGEINHRDQSQPEGNGRGAALESSAARPPAGQETRQPAPPRARPPAAQSSPEFQEQNSLPPPIKTSRPGGTTTTPTLPRLCAACLAW